MLTLKSLFFAAVFSSFLFIGDWVKSPAIRPWGIGAWGLLFVAAFLIFRICPKRRTQAEGPPSTKR